jgi:uncharacterized membrane protein YoaT (DUF817 family)
MFKRKFTHILQELWLFALKQANAAIFGALMLSVIILTNYIDITFITRYDLIFLFAVLVQTLLITFKLEEKGEIVMIAIFHILATIMELFKTSPDISSWHYPGTAYFMLYTVPLFAGFMYSAVGSYIARCWRIFKFHFSKYPPVVYTIILAALSYMNFITHHFVYDIRYFLFVFSAVIFWRTKIHFKIIKTHRSMPLLSGLVLVSLFIWFAENIGTFTKVWLYPNQTAGWQLVSWSKLGSWYLLMIVSFVLISTINRVSLKKEVL